MKKLIISLCVVSFLFTGVARAQTASSTEELKSTIAALQAQVAQLLEQLHIQQLIEALTAQVNTLMTQIAAIPTSTQPAQSKTLLPQSPVIGYVPPVVQEVQKTLSINANDCNINKNGRFCTVEVFYFENGKRVDTDAISISADDNGVFIGGDVPGDPSNSLRKKCTGGELANSDGTQRQGNPISCPTGVSGKDGKSVVRFQYLPQATGTRTLTATANGVTTTSTSPGQWIPSN